MHKILRSIYNQLLTRLLTWARPYFFSLWQKCLFAVGFEWLVWVLHFVGVLNFDACFLVGVTLLCFGETSLCIRGLLVPSWPLSKTWKTNYNLKSTKAKMMVQFLGYVHGTVCSVLSGISKHFLWMWSTSNSHMTYVNLSQEDGLLQTLIKTFSFSAELERTFDPW